MHADCITITRTMAEEDGGARSRLCLCSSFGFSDCSQSHYIEFDTFDVAIQDGDYPVMPGAAEHGMQVGIICMVRGTKHRTLVFCPADGRVCMEGYGVPAHKTCAHKQVMPPLDNGKLLGALDTEAEGGEGGEQQGGKAGSVCVWHATTGLLLHKGAVTVIRRYRCPDRTVTSVQDTGILASGFKGLVFVCVRLPYTQPSPSAAVTSTPSGPRSRIKVRLDGVHSGIQLREYL